MSINPLVSPRGRVSQVILELEVDLESSYSCTAPPSAESRYQGCLKNSQYHGYTCLIQL